MNGYTVLSIASLVAVWIADKILKTHVFGHPQFWHFQGIVCFLTILVDAVISGRPYVIFSPQVISGIRIGPTPIENIIYGFSLIAYNVIIFERLRPKGSHEYPHSHPSSNHTTHH